MAKGVHQRANSCRGSAPVNLSSAAKAYLRQYYRYVLEHTAPHHQCVDCGVWHQNILECPYCYHKVTEEEREQLRKAARLRSEAAGS